MTEHDGAHGDDEVASVRDDLALPVLARLADGWTVAVMAAAPVLAALFVGGALYGLLLGLIAEGGVEAIVPSLLVGSYLAFSAVGAESSATSAFSSAGDGVEVAIGTRMLPVGLWLFFAVVVLRSLRWLLRRRGQEPADALAAVLQLAVAIAVPLSIIASIVSFSDVVSTSELTSDVAAGSVLLYTLLSVLVIGLWHLRRSGLLELPDEISRRMDGRPGFASALASMVAGAKAALTLIAVAGLAVLIAAVVVADDPTERVLLVVGAPVHLVNLAAATAVGFMGGAVSYVGAGGADHVSLFNFGFPPGPDAGPAPVYVWVCVLVAPLVVVRATRHRLNESSPSTDEDVVRSVIQVAVGFAATTWLASAIGQFSLGGGAHDLRRGFSALEVAPSSSAALGLGMLWGFLGAGVAALSWARSRGMMASENVSGDAAADDPGAEAPSDEVSSADTDRSNR